MNQQTSQPRLDAIVSRDVCPFCGATRRLSTSVAWKCGTYQSDFVDGEAMFATGRECDLVSFRNALLRCSELLKEVAACGIEHTVTGRYHVVQVPIELMENIKAECGSDSSG